MLQDSLLPFSFPAVERKKVTAAFDGGSVTRRSCDARMTASTAFAAGVAALRADIAI